MFIKCIDIDRLRAPRAKFKTTMIFRVVVPLIRVGATAQGEAGAG